MRALLEFYNVTDWNAWESNQMMGARFDFILHLNVTMPDGTEENAMQWFMEDYRWNVSMIVKGLVFHA
jgi:hypothetical protein